MTTRAPFNGIHRKIVIAFDIGTTYSGVSYSILDPGQIPEIKGVNRFPAQERVGGDSKIPTVIYYDKDGQVKAVGAEATSEGVQETAEDEEWTKVEWFKLHLRPKTTSSASVTDSIPPLPENKSVVDVFSDFMRYLYSCTKTYIHDTHANGVDLWTAVERHIEFVLSHPNGWEGPQQELMRRAAIQASLVPDTHAGHERIHFVTEGEASLHFCVQSGLTTDAMKNGDGVLIVDAGGGTIDVSTYGQTKLSNSLSFEEIAPPQCYFQGSVFVTRRAHEFLKDLLRGSKFSDDINNITASFDKNTKLTFRNITEPQFIKFGSARDRDPRLNIRGGQLKLLGTDVAKFFEPSVTCITQAIMGQRKDAQRPISSIFLVGGFAASDWLFTNLKLSLEPLGLNFCRPDSHVSKAVADGGVSFYLDHFVAVRVAKFSYGVEARVLYNPMNSEHFRRSASVTTTIAGELRLPRSFSCILSKGTQVSETQEFRRPYFMTSHAQSMLERISAEIMCYRGTIANPAWLDTDSEMYSTLCIVEADTSHISRTLPQQWGPGKRKHQQPHYKLNYDIIMSFGLTELKAHICWKENGVEKRSPAKIVYDPNVVIHDS